MDTKARLRIEMAIRVRHFLAANPLEEPNAAAIAAKFDAKVGRTQDLVAQQESGLASARAARAKRGELRRQLHAEPLRQLAEIGRAASGEHPELADLFSGLRTGASQQQFRAAAQALLERVAGYKDIFLQSGMRPTLIEELTAQLADYDAAVTEADAGRRAHVGARVELEAVSKELVRMVAQLDAIMVYDLREKPELAGAWRSARNVAWPNRRRVGQSVPPPTEPRTP